MQWSIRSIHFGPRGRPSHWRVVLSGHLVGRLDAMTTDAMRSEAGRHHGRTVTDGSPRGGGTRQRWAGPGARSRLARLPGAREATIQRPPPVSTERTAGLVSHAISRSAASVTGRIRRGRTDRAAAAAPKSQSTAGIVGRRASRLTALVLAMIVSALHLPAVGESRVPGQDDLPAQKGNAARAQPRAPHQAAKRPPEDSSTQVAPQSRQPLTLARRIVIDLSKKETLWALPVRAKAADTRITDVEVERLPTAYRLEPADGIVRFGRPVDIILAQPTGVTIRLSLTQRSTGAMLRITPQVEFDQGGTMDFTTERIERSARSLERQIAACERRLSLAARECRKIEVWLSTPGNKPLDAVKGMRLKLRLLQGDILARQRSLRFALHHHAALQRLAEFVQHVHETAEIHFVLRVGGGD